MPQFRSSGVGLYVASERHVFMTDKYTKLNGTTRGVLYFPPHGFTAASVLALPVANALAESGFIVGAFDMGAPPGTQFQWANDPSMSRADSAFTYLTTVGGAKTDKVIVYGASGGGLGALLWAKRNPSLVAAIAVNIPALDIPYIHDQNVGSLATEIETAYGGAGTYATNVVGHSPSGFAANLAAIPSKVWHATDDEYTPLSYYTDFKANVGANCTLRSLGAVGHSLMSIEPNEVSSFMRLTAW